MDGKKSWILVVVLAVAYAPSLLVSWVRRQVSRINSVDQNPSRWNGDDE